MDYQVLGSNFVVSSMYGNTPIDEIDLLETDMTIARCGQSNQIRGLIDSNPNDNYLKLWLGLIKWWNGEYRGAYKLFKACNGMTRYDGTHDFRPYWYQAILMKDEMRTWDTWYSALGHFRSTANRLVNLVLDSFNGNFEPARTYLMYLNGYFSQAGHDALIEDFFNNNPPVYKKFVDIGAYDGVTMSNTRRMFAGGWAGICIEPVRSVFAKLKALYKGTNVVCVNCAVGMEDTEVNMELWENKAASRVLFGDSTKKTQPIHMYPINTVLEDNKIDAFDLLSIDVENLNAEVIQTLDLAKYRPSMIVVEYNDNEQTRLAIVNKLERFGYKLWFDSLQDLFLCTANSVSEPAFWNTKTLVPVRGK